MVSVWLGRAEMVARVVWVVNVDGQMDVVSGGYGQATAGTVDVIAVVDVVRTIRVGVGVGAELGNMRDIFSPSLFSLCSLLSSTLTFSPFPPLTTRRSRNEGAI